MLIMMIVAMIKIYDGGDLINGSEEVFRRPDPEEEEVGEHQQVEQSQVQEIGETAIVITVMIMLMKMLMINDH